MPFNFGSYMQPNPEPPDQPKNKLTLATFNPTVTANSEAPLNSSEQDHITERAAIHPPIETLLDALTFRLAHLNALTERAGTKSLRDNFDMSLNEWRVLGACYALEPVTFHSLREALNIDKGQLSRVINQLAARNMIETRPSKADGRSRDLRTTEHSRDVHSQLIAFTHKRNETLVGTLTHDECDEFLRLLTKITRQSEAMEADAERFE